MKGIVLAIVCLSALAGVACERAEAGTQVVVVEIEHSRFDPSTITVEPGATVRFVVHNNDPIPHEFLIGDEASQQRHEAGTEPEHGARPGELSIPPGETRMTTYTFPASADLLVGCHLPAHYDYGMRGEIRIR